MVVAGAWVCVAALGYCCTITHGLQLWLEAACTGVLAAGAVWVTAHR